MKSVYRIVFALISMVAVQAATVTAMQQPIVNEQSADEYAGLYWECEALIQSYSAQYNDAAQTGFENQLKTLCNKEVQVSQDAQALARIKNEIELVNQNISKCTGMRAPIAALQYLQQDIQSDRATVSIRFFKQRLNNIKQNIEKVLGKSNVINPAYEVKPIPVLSIRRSAVIMQQKSFWQQALKPITIVGLVGAAICASVYLYSLYKSKGV